MVHPPVPPRAPRATVERLLIYSRALNTLQIEGYDIVSSALLETRTFHAASQIRRDFTYLGLLGTRGKGYPVADVRGKISALLGSHTARQVALVGVGNLGSALLGYDGFAKHNFDIVAAFDVSPAKVGSTATNGVRVHHVRDLPEVARRANIDMAILAVPADDAQSALDATIEAGIHAILNFASARLRPRAPAHVRNIDLCSELGVLAYYCGLGCEDSGTGIA
jgi:redox-sensing transcriptional repressor